MHCFSATGHSKKRHTHACIPGVSSFQRAKVLSEMKFFLTYLDLSPSWDYVTLLFIHSSQEKTMNTTRLKMPL
jgi:hypothetical protein